MIGEKAPSEQEVGSVDFQTDRIYRTYKDPFFDWARFNFSLSDEEIKDVFQDTIIGFHQNFSSGRVEKIEFSTKTYLFAIGKNLILNKIKYNRRFDKDRVEFELQLPGEITESTVIKETAKDFIEKKIEELGEPCRTILKLYYYAGYSLEAIRREIKSKNPNVVKAQKSRCMRMLKNLFKERYDLPDFFDS